MRASWRTSWRAPAVGRAGALLLRRGREGVRRARAGRRRPAAVGWRGARAARHPPRREPQPRRLHLQVVNPTTAEEYHAADGSTPPKIKFRTCLELGNVPLDKLGDEAWWTVLCSGWAPTSMRRCLARSSVGRSRCCTRCCCPSWRATRSTGRSPGGSVCIEDGVDPLPAQTLRRSNSGHYGRRKHALKYLLLCSGLETAEIRRVSLLLRLQLFRLAQHDLKYVMQAGGRRADHPAAGAAAARARPPSSARRW